MKAKLEAQEAVQELRKRGLSYREIRQLVPVSKSSVSLWCRGIELQDGQQRALRERKAEASARGLATITRLRQSGKLPSRRQPIDIQEVEQIRELYCDEQLSMREVAARMGISFWRVHRLMQQFQITRRSGSEQNYVTYKDKPRFSPKQTLTQEEEQLRVAGTMLYLAEGAKRGGVVDFTNSDPRLIALFLAFLRRICGVSESRLRAHLYAYADQDIERLHKFWSEHAKIPLSQFIKPYVRPLTPNVSGRKMSLGLLHVRYSDRRLLELIQKWGKEICQSLGAGT